LDRLDYNGFSPIPSPAPDQPAIPTDHNNSLYEGAQLSLAINAAGTTRGSVLTDFAQQDDSLFPRRATDR